MGCGKHGVEGDVLGVEDISLMDDGAVCEPIAGVSPVKGVACFATVGDSGTAVPSSSEIVVSA